MPQISPSPSDLKFQFHPDNVIPTGDWVWVFGSNLAGRHQKGTAKVARVNFRAEYACGEGPTGRAYAIPTKDAHLRPLSLDEVAAGIARFIDYARAHPGQAYFVTRVGCDPAGHSDDQVGPLFADAPGNCSFPITWRAHVQGAPQ